MAAIDRTWYNTLVDDSGAGLDGSVISKASFNSLINAVDDALKGLPIISPTPLGANTNNWNPTSLSTARTIRISATAAFDLTGIVAQAASTLITLWNRGSFTITMKHASGSSSAANIFYCPGAADFSLTIGRACDIWYDGTSGLWALRG